MDDREKLIELLDDIQFRGEDFTDYEIYGMRLPNTVSNESVADHLIANGVTVQQWIPVSERLPENICPVLVALEGLSTAFNGWYHDGKWWTVGAGTRPFTQKVTHWMPLPEPPKES